MPPLSRVDLYHCSDDAHVEETDPGLEADVGEAYHLNDECVTTGQFDNRKDVAEEITYLIRPTV